MTDRSEADCISSDLVERVAEELWQADSLRVVGSRRSVPWSEAGPAAYQQWRPLARAAIAVALEEAAKVVTKHYQELCTEHRLLLVNRAAAIRALVKEPQ